MLCTGSRLRFTALTVGLHFLNWTSIGLPPIDVAATMSSSDDEFRGRRTNMFPILLPLNAASMHPVYGGYSLRLGPEFGGGASGKQLDIGLTPSISPNDAMTFRIVGLPKGSTITGPSTGTLVQDGTSTTCPQFTNACASSTESIKVLVCICHVRDRVREAVVRLRPSYTMRSVGLTTTNGEVFGIYDYTGLTVNLI